MLKYITVLCAIFLISCTGTYEQNQARMDDLYGCKKPGENLSKEKYKACLAKKMLFINIMSTPTCGKQH